MGNLEQEDKINVTFILASTGPVVGGMEKQVGMQANALADFPEINVTVIAPETYTHLFSDKVSFINEPFTQSRHNPLLSSRLKKMIRQSQADIVHGHGHKAVSLVAALKNNAPIKVGTAHGTKKNSEMFSKMDLAIGVSEGVRASLPEPSIVLRNAISLPANPCTKNQLADRFSLDPTRPIIIAVGRLDKVKRYDRLIEATLDINCNVLVIGDGPERRALEALSHNRVHFAGEIDKAHELISGADCLCISSEREGMSLVMLEALAAKVPVISTDVSGAKDLLPTKWIAQKPSDLANLIKQMLESNSTCIEDFHAAFEQIQTDLSPSAIADKLRAHYHRLTELKQCNQ